MVNRHNVIRVIGVVAACAAVVAVAGGCGGKSTPAAGSSAAQSAESNPAGDIPDNQAFVTYTAPNHWFTMKVPEGWARTDADSGVVFSDKFNSITLTPRSGFYQPTEEYARSVELPKIAATTPGFVAGDVKTVQRPAGQVVLVTYRADSPPSPVTGKAVPLDVERYEYSEAGRGVVVTLSSPVGADNVDPWRTVTDSFTWTS